MDESGLRRLFASAFTHTATSLTPQPPSVIPLSRRPFHPFTLTPSLFAFPALFSSLACMSFPSTTIAWTMQPPAYNTVQPRTTLQPVATAPNMSAPPAPRKVEWSPAVREYVRRAFDASNAIPGISSEEMQAKLKDTISYFAERNATHEVSWPTYPLPQELLRDERGNAGLSNGVPNGFSSAHALTANGDTNLASPMKKRKSQDAEELQHQSNDASIPLWRRTNLASRMTFTDSHNDKRQKKNNNNHDATSKFDQAELEKRRQRFQVGGGNNTTPPYGSPRKNDDEDEMSMKPVVGTNEELFKPYFRLTAPPKPETVRPLYILEQTLASLQTKWKAEKNYNMICNQFKSLRQDLTVQHIKNAFTVKVYESHARIALETGDLGEYNQCQTQLKALYAQTPGGNPDEFTAYRILYFVYMCNKTDMNDMLAELTLTDKTKECIKHALDVRSSLALGNYHKFFRLYLKAPNMGAYLMDMFVERERLAALANMSRSYLSVTLQFLFNELGFDNVEECREFFESHGAQNMIQADKAMLRNSNAHFESLRAAAFSKVDIKGQK